MDIISFNEASTANSRIESFIENPDSTSGIVTVPKVIASGETITIPAGRVAVLPNVQVDGVINIEGEVFVPSGSTYGDLDTQIALKADTSYVNTQLGLKANTADLKELGVGQTWQNVTASRVLGTTYTNSTGKPIMVAINFTTGTSGEIEVGGVFAGIGASTVTQATGGLTTVVPNNTTYKYIGGAAVLRWSELR